MTPTLTIHLLQALFCLLTCSIGSAIGEQILGSWLAGATIGLAAGLTVVLADLLLKGVSLRIFSSATFGLLLGFVFARLLLASDLFRYQDEETRWLLGLAIYLASGYLGMMLAMRSNRDEFAMIIPYIRFRQTGAQDPPVVIDSNICIDGRVLELATTGFLGRSLVAPRFVLSELQLLADASDPMRRERGRRGLDCLNRLQKVPGLSVVIHEGALNPNETVDIRLVRLSQLLQARLLTNDANLGKIARLENVTVLNLNELERALRPIVRTGDEVELALVKEGRDSHQAVGYMPDGTMIVVNHARERIGGTARVAVSSVVQTSAGRLVFADLK